MSRYSINQKAILLVCAVLVSKVSFAQTDCDERRNLRLRNNSFQCKWVYFRIKDSAVGIVVKHEKQRVSCGASAAACVTIVKTGNDTIRVIGVCNDYNYYRGQKITIFPGQMPDFQVEIPFKYDVIDEKTGKFIMRTNAYDETIFKTTFGEIFNPEL
jgi:hypothetical protein